MTDSAFLDGSKEKSHFINLLNHSLEKLRMPGEGDISAFRKLIEELNKQLTPNAKWSWRYLHQVYYGHLKPGKRFLSAVYRYAAKQARKQVHEYERVEIIAPKGFIKPRTFISIQSRECARKGCGRSFLPRNNRHRFCSRRCARIVAKDRS